MEDKANDTPAWAYKVAYERVFGRTAYTAECLAGIYKSDGSPFGTAMKSFAATIAAKEPELAPVDPDVEFVKDILLAFRNPGALYDRATFFDDGFRQEGFERAVAYYKQHKESAQ